MKALRQAGRMAWRDWRGGELHLLAAALVVAVAAITSVGFFVERITAGFERDAARLLGGDLVITGDQPVSAGFADEAARRGLKIARTVVFPSMAMQDGPRESEARAQLVGLKAVGAGYPLRGAVHVTPSAGRAGMPASDIPAPGSVWIDSQLIEILGVQVGATLRLGERRLRIEHLIAAEPDRGAGFINFAPRVMMRLDDLDSTGLIQPGARATYRLLIAGESAEVLRYRRWVAPQLGRGQRIESIARDGGERPEMLQTLGRAQTFLSLVALLTVVLAAVAVALTARRFVERHVDACAVMRCLGSTAADLTTVFVAEFVLLAALAGLVGAAIGYAAHFVLLGWVGPLVGVSLPAAGAGPALRGVASSLVLLIGFALPPLLGLRRVPPLRVLRRDLGPPPPSTVLSQGLGLAALAGLLFWFAEDGIVAAIAGAGFFLGLLVFAAATYVALLSAAALREHAARISVVLRFALAGALRRPASTVVQVVALAIGLMALLLLTLTRTDLVEGWRATAPVDAPNRFVINIQPTQRASFNEFMARHGMPRQDLLPMVRGRLIAVNDKPVSVDDYTGRAKRLVDREFNLSYMDAPPAHNRIVEGAWLAPDADGISVEQGLMKELGLKLGDRLSFDVAGSPVQARIGSARRVEWNSFKVNFFVIFPTRMLEPMQQSFITSFRMPVDRDFGARLVAEFPNLTIVDTGAILQQVQTVLDQVIAAVEFLFLFTLLAGLLVLYAALVAARDERLHEAALLRALGASRRQLARAQWTEFACIGALAGLLAALGASATGWALARYALDFSLTVDPALVLGGALSGAALAAFGGWLGLRQVLRQPPLRSLREA